ncbi:hypothetical protein PHLCEN_2v5409, partial [Hermanssonia centrifuga]
SINMGSDGNRSVLTGDRTKTYERRRIVVCQKDRREADTLHEVRPRKRNLAIRLPIEDNRARLQQLEQE